MCSSGDEDGGNVREGFGGKLQSLTPLYFQKGLPSTVMVAVTETW